MGSKHRMCIDYSTTINRVTKEDGYPFPLIEEIVNRLARYRRFSKFDLKAAYNQVAIPEADIPKTAFWANQRQFEYTRIPFGLRNAVSAFQRIMDNIIREEGLTDTFVYLDDVTIGGEDQAQHDLNVKHFEYVCKTRNLTLNNKKTIRNVAEVDILGYRVGNKIIRPGPEKLKRLETFPPPKTFKELQSLKGLLAYYSRWIPKFSSKLYPLTRITEFPIKGEALRSLR